MLVHGMKIPSRVFLKGAILFLGPRKGPQFREGPIHRHKTNSDPEPSKHSRELGVSENRGTLFWG